MIDSHFFDGAGGVVTGRMPVKLRLPDGYSGDLTRIQAAYNRFLAGTRNCIIGTVVKMETLADGSTVRIARMFGNDTITVVAPAITTAPPLLPTVRVPEASSRLSDDREGMAASQLRYMVWSGAAYSGGAYAYNLSTRVTYLMDAEDINGVATPAADGRSFFVSQAAGGYIGFFTGGGVAFEVPSVTTEGAPITLVAVRGGAYVGYATTSKTYSKSDVDGTVSEIYNVNGVPSGGFSLSNNVVLDKTTTIDRTLLSGGVSHTELRTVAITQYDGVGSASAGVYLANGNFSTTVAAAYEGVRSGTQYTHTIAYGNGTSETQQVTTLDGVLTHTLGNNTLPGTAVAMSRSGRYTGVRVDTIAPVPTLGPYTWDSINSGVPETHTVTIQNISGTSHYTAQALLDSGSVVATFDYGVILDISDNGLVLVGIGVPSIGVTSLSVYLDVDIPFGSLGLPPEPTWEVESTYWDTSMAIRLYSVSAGGFIADIPPFGVWQPEQIRISSDGVYVSGIPVYNWRTGQTVAAPISALGGVTPL